MPSYLPEKIFLYCKKPEIVNNDYLDDEDDDDDYEDGLFDEDEDALEGVRHAFPVSDQSSQSRHENAEEWSSTYHYDGKNRTKIIGDIFEYPNCGFSSVTIKDLDIRGQGGRAYQVVLEHDNKKFRVDLREDALMDVIRNTGIQAGGKLNGTFCFIVDGSQTNLVREHSKVWKNAKKGAESRKTATLKKSELKIGHRYKTLSGDTAVYLGEVYSRNLSIKEDESISSYRRGGTGKIECGKVTKKMLFINSWGDDELEWFKKGQLSLYNIKLQISQSYREDLGKVGDIDTDTVISCLNRIGQEGFDKALKEASKSMYDNNMISYIELIEASKTKDIKEEKEKIDQSFKAYKDYYKKLNRWW